MRRHQHPLTAQHPWQDLLKIVGEHPGGGIAQAFAPRGGNGIRAPPDVDLLLAPTRPCIILIEANDLAIVPLVERLVLEDRNVALAELLEHEIERSLRPNEG